MSAEFATPVQRCLYRLKFGDPTARDELLRLCLERFRVMTSKMFARFKRLRRWVDTDDVMNDALMRLNHSLEAIQPDTTRQFLSLAAVQIRRVLLDLIRRYFGPLGIATSHHTPGPEGIDLADFAEAADSDPADLSQWAEFHDAVDKLPEEIREVVDLHWYGGMTLTEVAAEMELSPIIVKRRWLEARLELAKVLPEKIFTSL